MDNKDDLTMVLGGAELTVKKRDGSEEKVRVRELKVSELQSYFSVIDDEEKTAELFCDKEAGWGDLLTRESFLSVISKGEDLNLVFFLQTLERRLDRQRKMIAGVDEKFLAVAQMAIAATKTPLAAAESGSAASA